MALDGLGASDEEDTCADGSHNEDLSCNQTTVPPPALLQILELNKRMSAVEHLLDHLENAVLPHSVQVTPWPVQDQPTAFRFRKLKSQLIASGQVSQRSCSWLVLGAPRTSG